MRVQIKIIGIVCDHDHAIGIWSQYIFEMMKNFVWIIHFFKTSRAKKLGTHKQYSLKCAQILETPYQAHHLLVFCFSKYFENSVYCDFRQVPFITVKVSSIDKLNDYGI